MMYFGNILYRKGLDLYRFVICILLQLVSCFTQYAVLKIKFTSVTIRDTVQLNHKDFLNVSYPRSVERNKRATRSKRNYAQSNSYGNGENSHRCLNYKFSWLWLISSFNYPKLNLKSLKT